MIFATVATSDTTVQIAFITFVGTVFTAMFKLLNNNTKALSKLVTSNEKIAAATAKGAREAKQRNGHLGDQSVQLAKLVTQQNKDVASIKQSTQSTAEILSKSALIAAEDRDLLVSGTQHIDVQKVDKQIIEGK